MNDDRAFLDSLIASPKDAAPWLVYADWLDERGDPRGEYLRLVHDLAQRPDDIQRRRLNAVRPTLPREWLAVVEQPALLRANPTPYSANWPGIGLGEVRPINRTYGGDAYASLPAVPVDWLVRFDEMISRMAAPLPNETVPDYFYEDDATSRIMREEQRTVVPRLSAAAIDFGLRLPEQFAGFIEDSRHPFLFTSATSCYFNFSERIEPAPECPEVGLLRFYSASQSYLHWYLYLTPEGDECVVASSANVGGSWSLRQLDPYRVDSDDVSKADFWFCAPSFAEFIVRTWLENAAWYSLHTNYTGAHQAEGWWTAEVQAYLAHYRSVSPA